MFSHIYKARLRYYVRVKIIIFWIFLFPIILTSLFRIAFSEIMSSEKFEIIDIAMIKEENTEYPYADIFEQVMETLASGEDPVFCIQPAEDRKDAEELLQKGKISAYILIGEQPEMVIQENGIDQSIIKEVMDTVVKRIYLGQQLYQVSGQLQMEQLQAGVADYIETKKIGQDEPDTTYIYYFAALAMTCLMGFMFGVGEVNSLQANLSGVGMRNALSPVPKWKQFIGGFLSSCTIMYVLSVLVLLYIHFVLGIRFGDRSGYVLLQTVMGSTCGISIGMCLSVLIKKSESAKIGILTAITLASSFFAGLMLDQMKYLVQEKVPFFAKINPATLIADGYYKLYYYENTEGFWSNMLNLVIITAICLGIAITVLRRQKYDSV